MIADLDLEEVDDLDDVDDPARYDAEIFEFFFLHAHEEGAWDEICSEIDEHGFLAEQAEHFQGFAQSTMDLEGHILPAAMDAKDWDRFLQYALTAVNLRGLAESLADEAVFASLVKQGRLKLAGNLADQLAEDERQAWAWAVIATHASGEERADRVRQVREMLRNLPPAATPAEHQSRLDLLAGIARHLGPDLLADWKNLVDREATDPKRKARLWLEVAGACLRAEHPGFRSALREIGDREILITELPHLWLSHGPADLQAIRDLAQDLGDTDGRLFWSLALPLLARQAEKDVAAALTVWYRENTAGPPVPWSERLIDTGGKLFGSLDEEEAERIAAGLREPGVRAAFHVVRLEHLRNLVQSGPAIETVRALTDREPRLHWSLRALLAWPGNSPERRGLTASVMRYLSDIRYAAPVEDLCRFLDLVADVFPRELPRQIESAVWAPDSKPTTLLALAEGAEAPAVLANLFDSAESYAAVAGPTEAEAFELRAQVLSALACRLAVRDKSLKPVHKALERLLPEEQDALRVSAARALAAAELGNLASDLAGGIRLGRLQLATRLAAEKDTGTFNLAELYQKVASTDVLDDERLALSALAEPALDAEMLLERHLVPMRSKERQGRALVDLAHHALAFELAFYRKGQQDPLAPIQLLRSSLTGTGSDERLLALTLELVELAAPLPHRRALAELHAALDAILKLEKLSWPTRIEAIETLLSRIKPVLLDSLEPGDPQLKGRYRGIAGFFESLISLPARTGAVAALTGLRQHWPEIPPILVRALECLPSDVRGRWTRKITEPWAGIGQEEMEILRLCAASPADRLGAARRLLAEMREPSFGRAQALCYLLSRTAPEIGAELAGRLPRGADRDRLCARLVRNGWLPPQQSGELLLMMQEQLPRLRAEVLRHTADGKGSPWLSALASLISRGGLDPLDPASWSALRGLWKENSGEERQILGRAVIEALSREGRKAGEDALCVWLNAHFAPRIGGELADREERNRRLCEALQRGLSIVPGISREPEAGSPPSAPTSLAGPGRAPS